MAQEGKQARGGLTSILAVTGVLCLIGAFGWIIWRGYMEPGSVAFGALGILLYIASFLRAEAANLRHYVAVSLYTAFVLGICVVIYLGVRRHEHQFDLTSRKIHTLAPATTQYLKLLKDDIKVTVFDLDRRAYQPLLDRYAELTPRLTWEMHDPRADPAFTLQFGSIVMDGSVFVTHGEQRKQLGRGAFDESILTNAIVEVTRETRSRVYFLQGHGELPYEVKKGYAAGASESVEAFKDYLATQAVDVAPLSLTATGVVPMGTDLIIIAGPTADLGDAEADMLDDYLTAGGKLLVLLDPPRRKGVYPEFDNLGSLLAAGGIEPTQNLILDAVGERQQSSAFKVPFQTLNPDHAITRPLAEEGYEALYVPWVASLLQMRESDDELRITPLAVSSQYAWTDAARRILESNEPTRPLEEAIGEQVIGFAIEQPKSERRGMRMVVFGSSELMKNNFMGTRLTAQVIMLNSVNWLLEREDLVSIAPRRVEGTPLELTNAQMQMVMILIGLALPCLIFFCGASYTRMARRR